MVEYDRALEVRSGPSSGKYTWRSSSVQEVPKAHGCDKLTLTVSFRAGKNISSNVVVSVANIIGLGLVSSRRAWLLQIARDASGELRLCLCFIGHPGDVLTTRLVEDLSDKILRAARRYVFLLLRV